MLLPFSQLKKHSFTLDEISVIKQTPSYREFSTTARRMNGFLYIESGICRYTFEEGAFELHPGAVTYLPIGSVHKMQILSESITFYRVNFTLLVNGEIALFSTHPQKITDNADSECVTAIKKLCDDFSLIDDSIGRTEQLCIILRSLQTPSVSRQSLRIRPALDYIRAHLTEHIDCTYLSSLCFLGSTQFYTIFSAEMGETPLSFRNRLLIDRAKQLLSTGELSVSETAMRMGFDTSAYFSRFFKKQTGMSPSEYVNRQK